ncbi:phage tail domain-containing protein [Micromonospora okii]|uniref:phage tail domain-containing protein n=1 Tax=Micromonospora okii TaxID=1182970 RepID=UPI001E645D24|nr:phage tail domain-containing protein [Micromonospora okii]
MPLIISGQYRGPVIPAPGPPPALLPFVADDPTATYLDPRGGVWPLSDPAQGWATLDAVAGLGAVVYDLTTDAHPRGGSRLRHAQPQSRVITWPVLVWGDTHAEFLTRWRALARALTMTLRAGPGRLRVYRPDGSAREVLVRYQGGFEGEPGQGITYDTAIVSLLAEDPYWRDPPTTLRFSQATPRPFLNPYPSLSASRVFGDVTVTNSGDVEAWPDWVLRGPCNGLAATNLTAGESFTLTYALGPGEEVRITTDPPAVRGPAGQPLTSALAWPGAVLWALTDGANRVRLTVPGSGPGAEVALSFTPRHETA